MSKLLLVMFFTFIFISFSISSVFANEYIYRTKAITLPVPKGVSDKPRYPTMPFRLTFYSKFQVNDRGYQLGNGDLACIGDQFSIQQEITGEFFAAGGSEDSPPIMWKSKTLSFSGTDIKLRHGYTFWCTYLSGWCYDFVITCSQNCVQSGNLVNKVVASEGTLNFNQRCPIGCSVDVGLYQPANKANVQTFGPYPIGGPTIEDGFSIRAVSSSTGPNVIISQAFVPSPETLQETSLEASQQNPVVKIAVQNNGDMNAMLQSANLNVPSKVLYMPKSLAPGQNSEIIIESNSLEDLKLTLNYKSDKLGCLTTKDFSKTFDLDTLLEVGQRTSTTTTTIISACTSEGDCNTGFICCQAQCRDPATGVCRDVNGDGISDWIHYGS